MLIEMGKRARAAGRILGRTTTEQRNAVLASLAERRWAREETDSGD